MMRSLFFVFFDITCFIEFQDNILFPCVKWGMVTGSGLGKAA